MFFAAALIQAQTRDSLRTKPIRRDSLGTAERVRLNDTTASKRDSLKKIPEVVIPLHKSSFNSDYEFNNQIKKSALLFNDYRYTADYLRLFPLAFIRDLGSLGQPGEVLLYGAGFNQTSYLHNGMLINNRLTNSFGLNMLQSESVDSIEVLPLPRGFLYGTLNNPASVNFISKDSYSIGNSKAPYSRIRYYQAPDEEAMIDFIYSAYFSRRLITTVEVTNKTIGERFPNSAFSIWNGSAKVKYLLSNTFNISGSYGYVKSQTGLYGGLTKHFIDSVGITNLPDQGLNVEVNYPSLNGISTRYEKNTLHNFSLQLLSSYFKNFKSELNAYYRYSLNEFRQNEKRALASMPYISDNNKARTYGVSLRQIYTDTLFNADMSGIYERNEFETRLLRANENKGTLALSGRLSSILFNRTLIPSVYAKYLNYSGGNYIGAGADITLHISDNLKLYGGLSRFNQPLSPIERSYSGPDTISNRTSIMARMNGITSSRHTVMEAGAELRLKNFSVGAELFSRYSFNTPSAVMLKENNSATGFIPEDSKIYGAGLNLNFNLWRIYLESRSAYYSVKESNYPMPDFTFNGGIYYRDTLFNANLHLKAGFMLQAAGAQKFYAYDFERNVPAYNFINYGSTSIYNINETAAPFGRLDFVLIGEIQGRAIIYFTFENILSRNYYVVPYYITQAQGIRLGFSWEFLN